MAANHNDFPAPRDPTTPKVRIDTLRACCVRLWYERWAEAALPADGLLICPCGHTARRDAHGWWRGPLRSRRRDLVWRGSGLRDLPGDRP